MAFLELYHMGDRALTTKLKRPRTTEEFNTLLEAERQKAYQDGVVKGATQQRDHMLTQSSTKRAEATAEERRAQTKAIEMMAEMAKANAELAHSISDAFRSFQRMPER